MFRQVIGIPMGTDCAPFLANLFLYSYEYQFIKKQIKFNMKIYDTFRSCCRYIDDLLVINNFDYMHTVKSLIYPKELVLVPDDSDGLHGPFLDFQLEIQNGVISSSIFDKRDAFDFEIVNFPTLSGNIPIKNTYGVFIGEAVRYARACTYYKDFKKRVLSLVQKLKKQFFTQHGLNRAWLTFCDSHLLLIQKYGSTVLNLCNEWM